MLPLQKLIDRSFLGQVLLIVPQSVSLRDQRITDSFVLEHVVVVDPACILHLCSLSGALKATFSERRTTLHVFPRYVSAYWGFATRVDTINQGRGRFSRAHREEICSRIPPPCLLLRGQSDGMCHNALTPLSPTAKHSKTLTPPGTALPRPARSAGPLKPYHSYQ